MAKKQIRSLEEIKKDALYMVQMSCKSTLPYPKVNTVIDEDKSVKWNREEVERQRKAYTDDVAKRNTKKNKLRDELTKELYKTIASEVGGISEEKAKLIWQYCYAEWHSVGINSMFDHLNTCIDRLCKQIINNTQK